MLHRNHRIKEPGSRTIINQTDPKNIRRNRMVYKTAVRTERSMAKTGFKPARDSVNTRTSFGKTCCVMGLWINGHPRPANLTLRFARRPIPVRPGPAVRVRPFGIVNISSIVHTTDKRCSSPVRIGHAVAIEIGKKICGKIHIGSSGRDGNRLRMTLPCPLSMTGEITIRVAPAVCVAILVWTTHTR